jgi:bacillopeptidase F (M6 metalloprotease family)
MKKFVRLFLMVFTLIFLVSCSTQEHNNHSEKSTKESENKVETKPDDSSNSKSAEQNEVTTMIANDEKIIQMLKEKGEIPEDATTEEINNALQKYLQQKNPGSLESEKAKKKYIEELKQKIQKESKTSE